MGIFSGLRRLFKSTEDIPPPLPSGFQPAGLDEPDSAEELQILGVSISADNENNAPIPRQSEIYSVDGLRVTVTLVDSEELNELEDAYQREKAAAPKNKRQPPRSNWKFIAEDVFGITFMIEYRDSKGVESRRRISMRGLHINDAGTIFVTALCHERHAIRTFRLDRILSIIDADGVVHEPAPFFASELRIDLTNLATEEPTKDTKRAQASGPRTDSDPARPGHAHRGIARDGLRILCAVSRSDSHMHEEEIEIITRYIVEEGEDAGLTTTDSDIDALKAYVRRQRPSEDVLDVCISRLEAASARKQQRLMEAVIEVIGADGEQHEAEFSIAQNIQQKLRPV